MIQRPGTITIEDFDRMIEEGYFDRVKQRVDLIRGEIICMNAAGPMHDEVVTRLTEWSSLWARRSGCRVRTEKGIKLPPVVSEPEPAIVWVVDKDYMADKPYAQDIALLIEVSDSSLNEDRIELVPLYAEAGISEYWIVNCADQCIEVHRHPVDGEYTEQFIVDFGDEVSPLVAPEAVVDVAGLFARRT